MDQKQFDAVLTDAELRLRRLKTLYEQWFMGIERMEPATPRKELEDMLARLRKEQVSNTAQRFRLQQLVQRHVSFATHWRRIGRQIEEGTYQRDVLRAKRRAQHAGGRSAEPELEESYDVDIDVDLAEVLEEANRAAEAAVASPQRTLIAETSPLGGAREPANDISPRALQPTAAGVSGVVTSVWPPMAAKPSRPAEPAALADAPGSDRAPAEQRRSSAPPRVISPFAFPTAGSLRPKPLEPPSAPAPPPPLLAKAPRIPAVPVPGQAGLSLPPGGKLGVPPVPAGLAAAIGGTRPAASRPAPPAAAGSRAAIPPGVPKPPMAAGSPAAAAAAPDPALAGVAAKSGPGTRQGAAGGLSGFGAGANTGAAMGGGVSDPLAAGTPQRDGRVGGAAASMLNAGKVGAAAAGAPLGAAHGGGASGLSGQGRASGLRAGAGATAAAVAAANSSVANGGAGSSGAGPSAGTGTSRS
ncbi:MAG: hypothetical protein ABW321_06070, partial [Polyangiales bacterium]